MSRRYEHAATVLTSNNQRRGVGEIRDDVIANKLSTDSVTTAIWTSDGIGIACATTPRPRPHSSLKATSPSSLPSSPRRSAEARTPCRPVPQRACSFDHRLRPRSPMKGATAKYGCISSCSSDADDVGTSPDKTHSGSKPSFFMVHSRVQACEDLSLPDSKQHTCI